MRRSPPLSSGVRSSNVHSLHARNPMMYRLIHKRHDSLVVLRVSSEVLDIPNLDIPNTVVTDGNAATYGTRFHPSPEGLC